MVIKKAVSVTTGFRVIRIAVLFSSALVAVALLSHASEAARATSSRASTACTGVVIVSYGTFSHFVVSGVTCGYAKTFARKQITGGGIPSGWLCSATKTSAKSFNNACGDGGKSIAYHFLYGATPVTSKTATTGTTTTTPTTTTPSPKTTGATMVTVIAGDPMTFTFKLSTATQPKIVSDEPATELTVPSGEVTFNVSNPEANILSHNFEVCSLPLPGPLKTLPAIQKLPNSCTGDSTAVLAPGGSPASLTVDFTTPGTYEYLSTANGRPAVNDASSGMKGVLNVT